MGHSVSKDVELLGKFVYELWDDFDIIKRVGNFDTMKLAEQAAQQAQREHIENVAELCMEAPASKHVSYSLHTSQDNVDKFAAMSDDEF